MRAHACTAHTEDRRSPGSRLMNPESPWFRFIVGLVMAAIAIRIVVDLIRPILPYLAGGIMLVGAFQLARWWRDRW